MTIRFTDSNKFRDKWYMGLTPIQKCIWEYFVSECNHAGILEVSLRMMSVQINDKITEAHIDFFIEDKKALWVTEDKLFIPNFVLFQQRIHDFSELNIKNRCHKSIIDEFNKYDIWGKLAPSKPLVNPLEGACKPLNQENGESDTILEKLSPLEAPSKGLARGYSNSNSKSNSISISNNTNNTKDNKKDIFCNKDFDKCFQIYQNICTNLVPLRFERRSKAILELLRDFLEETEYNFEYLNEVCTMANGLQTIMDTKIDFKMLLKNHAGIVSGKYGKSIKTVNDYKY